MNDEKYELYKNINDNMSPDDMEKTFALDDMRNNMLINAARQELGDESSKIVSRCTENGRLLICIARKKRKDRKRKNIAERKARRKSR